MTLQATFKTTEVVERYGNEPTINDVELIVKETEEKDRILLSIEESTYVNLDQEIAMQLCDILGAFIRNIQNKQKGHDQD